MLREPQMNSCGLVHLAVPPSVLVAQCLTELGVPLVVGGALPGPHAAWVVDVGHAPGRLISCGHHLPKPGLRVPNTLEVRDAFVA